jgi:hypothetical protein
MSPKTLNAALQAHKPVSDAYLHSCRTIWAAFRHAEPGLANDIPELGWAEAKRLTWIVAPLIDGLSPSELVVAGRGGEVSERVSGALDGFLG